jgi:hypothetical protein
MSDLDREHNAFAKEVGVALEKMVEGTGAKAAARKLADMAAADGGTATISYKGSDGERKEFELEPTPPPGKVPERVINELIHVRNVAKDYASSYSEAAKAKAEQYKVNVAALKRFIAAKCDDKLAEAAEEADALAKLLDS